MVCNHWPFGGRARNRRVEPLASAFSATRFAAKCLASYLAGTPALGTFYGLCGATVGSRMKARAASNAPTSTQ